jgi:ParB family transcriptional regulator, chromosome partitioning protein
MEIVYKKIVYKKIDELIPYDNNPRINEDAVEYVKNSIKEFGFKNPIILDKNNIVICGHTRLLASKELKLKEVPCIIADDLNEEQVKALRLADNKVAEKSMWDYSKLDEELNDIINIDMSMFDFNISTDDIFENDVEEETEGIEKKMLKCPKCGHINEEKAFKYYEDTD